MRSERRKFLRAGPMVLAAVALARTGGAQAAPHLDPNDATAKALGYAPDAAKADKAKFPNWKAGETCSGCVQFKGKPAAAWGPCQIFPGKEVSGKGWCSAWQKKA